eukprot:m.131013 g.131013  ORF g.131013 m.131013 type:complete len:322 (-) comp13741_c0_seq2:2987-3952(-)
MALAGSGSQRQSPKPGRGGMCVKCGDLNFIAEIHTHSVLVATICGEVNCIAHNHTTTHPPTTPPSQPQSPNTSVVLTSLACLACLALVFLSLLFLARASSDTTGLHSNSSSIACACLDRPARRSRSRCLAAARCRWVCSALLAAAASRPSVLFNLGRSYSSSWPKRTLKRGRTWLSLATTIASPTCFTARLPWPSSAFPLSSSTAQISMSSLGFQCREYPWASEGPFAVYTPLPWTWPFATGMYGLPAHTSPCPPGTSNPCSSMLAKFFKGVPCHAGRVRTVPPSTRCRERKRETGPRWRWSGSIAIGIFGAAAHPFCVPP